MGRANALFLDTLTKKDIESYDLFNSNFTRADVDEREFNCMAYAFGAYEWLCPIDHWRFNGTIARELLEECNLSSSSTNIDILYEAVLDGEFQNVLYEEVIIKTLLKRITGLRRINDFNDLKENEYGIVYASSEYDFHFCKFEPRTSTYSHKMGSCSIEVVESIDDAFGCKYDGKRYYFAMDRDFVNTEIIREDENENLSCGLE